MGLVTLPELNYQVMKDFFFNPDHPAYLPKQSFLGTTTVDSSLSNVIRLAAEHCNTLNIAERFPFRIEMMKAYYLIVQKNSSDAWLWLYDCAEKITLGPRTVDELIAVYLTPGQLLFIGREDSAFYQGALHENPAEKWRKENPALSDDEKTKLRAAVERTLPIIEEVCGTSSEQAKSLRKFLRAH